MNRTWSPFQAAPNIPTAPALESQMADGRYLTTQEQFPSSEARNETIRGETPDHIRSVTMSFRDMHAYGDLLVNYLEARKSIFRDKLGWHVPEADGMEFDQYDTPFCRWVVLHEYGEVLGGVRMLPTTAKCGIYSYMLRDAQLGVLDDLPTDVLFFKAPVEDSVWEATRFFVTDAVPAKRRRLIQSMLFKSMSQTAIDNGATHILGIVPSVWSRWARRLGVDATPIGAKFSIDGTASQSVLFRASDFII